MDRQLTPTLEQELTRFRTALDLAARRLPSLRIAPDVLCLGPDMADVHHAMNAGMVTLTVLGLVHGNEVGGVPVLTSLLEGILGEHIQLKRTMAIGLGNVAAGLAGKRFLDRDLNRSFGGDSLGASREGQRARELQPLLARTRFLLDLHQTREPSKTPFFIFPFARKSFDFARTISRDLPVVTHWGGSFSQDGMCTDEYVNSRGGTGITLELGQSGFDPAQLETGCAVTLRAINGTGAAILRDVPPVHAPGEFRGSIYTWGGVMPFPATGKVDLVPGLVNFQEVSVGDLIATHDGMSVKAPASGRILFPKYIRPGTPDASAPRPAELCRIIRTVMEEELPA